mmetsp:Transcript_48932/g.140141  ORF Transcript_48932/g.140141 Transcript_48932/m.140141 type:complete len:238 (-) Transcript_48932:310-1023(-)
MDWIMGLHLSKTSACCLACCTFSSVTLLVLSICCIRSVSTPVRFRSPSSSTLLWEAICVSSSLFCLSKDSMSEFRALTYVSRLKFLCSSSTKIFTISSMSEMPVVDLIVAKACSNTSMFFWCCLMCRRWIAFRKAIFRILLITAVELKFSSSSAFRLLVLLFLSSSVFSKDSLTMATRWIRSSRSRSFISFCSFCTVPLKPLLSISSCFLRAAMRCWRSSSSRLAMSASFCSEVTCD